MPEGSPFILALTVLALVAMASAFPGAQSTTISDSIASFLDAGSCESACAKACKKACDAPVYCDYTSSYVMKGTKATCDCTCETVCFLGMDLV